MKIYFFDSKNICYIKILLVSYVFFFLWLIVIKNHGSSLFSFVDWWFIEVRLSLKMFFTFADFLTYESYCLYLWFNIDLILLAHLTTQNQSLICASIHKPAQITNHHTTQKPLYSHVTALLRVMKQMKRNNNNKLPLKLIIILHGIWILPSVAAWDQEQDQEHKDQEWPPDEHTLVINPTW